MPEVCPQLLTPGRIAESLGVPLHRVQHVLYTRRDIKPSARAGTLRLFNHTAMDRIRDELAVIDARRSREGGTNHA